MTQAGLTLRAGKDRIVGLQAIDPLGTEAFPECRRTEAQHSSPATIEQRGSFPPASRDCHALEHEIAVEWGIRNSADRVGINALRQGFALLKLDQGSG